MIELMYRVGFFSMMFALVIIAIVLWAVCDELKREKREVKRWKKSAQTSYQVSRRLQSEVDILLEERKKNAVKVSLAEAVLKENKK